VRALRLFTGEKPNLKDQPKSRLALSDVRGTSKGNSNPAIGILSCVHGNNDRHSRISHRPESGLLMTDDLTNAESIEGVKLETGSQICGLETGTFGRWVSLKSIWIAASVEYIGEDCFGS
jgi:hypothetical protein